MSISSKETANHLAEILKELDSLDFQEKVKNNEIIGFRSQGNIEN